MYESGSSNLLGTYVIILVVLVLIFLLCRELICWYYKINKIVVLMEDQNNLLKKFLEKRDGNSDLGDSSNPENIESELVQSEIQKGDEIIMEKYNISFKDGKYIYSGFSYKNLKDAVNASLLSDKFKK